ncbi:MAG TPA: winged helix-turn-helix domain-containing protein [Candidatus Acidoferrum sp.]|nr:winged helix-turn-helix domain-containing protein [Candidatus Acidoferrum sp.]
MTSHSVPCPESEMDSGANQDPARTARYVRFGPYQIDQHRQMVMRRGVRLKMHGKVYQALLTLVQKQGQIVTREELKQALWSANTFVNYDANVNTTVNKLRQVLGDSPDRPTYIETIPRKGYVFVGQAEYSAAPFPNAATPEEIEERPESEKAATDKNAAAGEFSNRWVTVGVILFILAGILLGAGIATLWISHLTRRGSFF